MYSNDTTQIRAGMVNYIGALVNASKFQPKAAKHDVSAILIEEALKLAKDENGFYDFYVLKPMFRANRIVLENHIKEIDKDIDTLPKEMREILEEKKAMYQSMIVAFDDLI